ncbi:MAG TPA: 6-phospho-beta-glucosidase [Actinomycetota bacterium]|jgi:6-phospho-beta-glucosidase|nr:6-phospho-beta-glucosidase [Actinomycetota bacterium]
MPADVGVKIAVVGGGSTYTPELVEGFVTRDDRLTVDELVLLDVDAKRLDVVGGLADRMLRRAGWTGTLVRTSRRDEALDGAQFVIVQLRVGGQAARLNDETIPLRFGCVGQETTGPGGFAKALRTVPVVLELAEEIERRGAPGAWLVDFTNPTGLITQSLLDRGHRALGLCNVAINMQRGVAKQLGVEPERVQLEHVGLNHLSWERAVFVDGVDRLPELLGTDMDSVAEQSEMPAELLAALRAVPSSYLHYYYFTNEVLERQRSGGTRAEEVMRIEAGLLELYRDPSLDVKPKLLEQRGGAYYSDAAAALVASLHAGTGDVQVVDVRNDGAIPNLPTDAVVEVAATIDHDGAHPLHVAPLAPEMLGLVEHAKAYELLTIDAATSGDRVLALKALMTNPLVGGYDVARPLLDALLEANREHLPRFFPN